MFTSFEEQDGTPHDVRRFEQLWFMAIFLSALVAITMYDSTVMAIGKYPALLTNIAFFGASIVLMAYASRRRSNVARALTIPFLILILFYDLSHLGELMDGESNGYLVFGTLGRLALIVMAICMLFTINSRAWFSKRSSPTAGVEED